MTGPVLYNEGIALEVDITPPWWTGGMEYTRAAADAILNAGEDLHETFELTIGIKRVVVRMFWPVAVTAADIAAWRSRMIARIEAQPGMADRKAQWAEWQEERRQRARQRLREARERMPAA